MALNVSFLTGALNKVTNNYILPSVTYNEGDWLFLLEATIQATAASYWRIAGASDYGGTLEYDYLTQNGGDLISDTAAPLTVYYTRVGTGVTASTTHLGRQGVAAVYKVTDADFEREYVPAVSSTSSLYGSNLNGIPHLHFIRIMPCTITGVTMRLRRTSTASAGNVYVRLRKVSDDSIIGSLDPIAASSVGIGASGTLHSFTGSIVNTFEGEARLTFEISDSATTISPFRAASIPDFYANGVTCGRFVGGAYDRLQTQGDTLGIDAISGLKYLCPIAGFVSTFGSSATPSSSSLSVSVSPTALIGAIATEGPVGDAAGTWGTDIDQNTFRDGTTGGSAVTNVTLAAAAELKSSTGSFAASKTGIDSRDWTAFMVVLRETTAPPVEPPTGGQNIFGPSIWIMG